MMNQTSKTQFFKKNENLLFVVMLNLFYPAVLGSIIYSVFGNLGTAEVPKWDEINFSCLVMMVSVITFFSIDYIYTSLQSTYGFLEFGGHVLLLVMMQGAFRSINFLASTPNPMHFSRYMAVTFAVFFIWDFAKREGIGGMFKYILSFEMIYALLFSFMGVVDTGFLLPGLTSAVTATGAIGFFLSFYYSPARPPHSVSVPQSASPQPLGPGVKVEAPSPQQDPPAAVKFNVGRVEGSARTRALMGTRSMVADQLQRIADRLAP